jgi:N-acetyl-anhydromuramyl-L-alanine amidase AmpD
MMMPAKYPHAHTLYTPDKPGVGPMGAHARGVTVHYTASGSLISALREEVHGLGYHILIDRDGSTVQTCYLTLRVNHAGKANWNGDSPNKSHLAVAFVSWGLLDGAGYSYAGVQVPKEEIRTDEKGKWHAATPQQEDSLLRFLGWAVSQGINRNNICGHDECALPKGRKVDPGGCLSFRLADFRNDF